MGIFELLIDPYHPKLNKNNYIFQKSAIELYEDMSQIREKVLSLGAKDPGKPEEVGFFTAASTVGKRLDPILASGAGEQTQIQIPIPDPVVTNEFVISIEENLQAIPYAYLTLCEEALEKRMEILSWLTDFRQDESGNEITMNSGLIKQIEVFRSEDQNLIEKLNNTKKVQSELIEDLVKKSGILWAECQAHRIRVREVENLDGNQLTELKQQLISQGDELKAERDKANHFKERKTILENQLQKVRTRIRDLEGQVNSGESRIHQLQTTVKQLEGQVKQKESSLEQRTREIQKIAKSNENVISKLEKQKENLESRLFSLFLPNPQSI